MVIAYRTEFGTCFHGLAEDILNSSLANSYRKSVNLIFTSPPFPLNRKKSYGNLTGEKYINWLSSFAPIFRDFLHPQGSIVIEVGNAWECGRPVMSTLALRALLAFLDQGEFILCQQFVWHNPARLPTPAQWVNIERIRVKDTYTHIWWMSTTDRPKADNRRVLKAYSEAMQRLLKTKKYNSGKRPSGHHIGEKSFLKDNKGAIPSNVITVANTHANTSYLQYCRENNLQPHPARMPRSVAEFFIKFLTDPNDVVLDPFAGSNTTGEAAEILRRRWVAVEPEQEYVLASRGRFNPLFQSGK
ncbi:MAG: site-specific DNA-methyltransferase [Chloroflexi bacterium]|nr:site-specific DNA-methyltransferase [Chloroflexota bacterium]